MIFLFHILKQHPIKADILPTQLNVSFPGAHEADCQNSSHRLNGPSSQRADLITIDRHSVGETTRLLSSPATKTRCTVYARRTTTVAVAARQEMKMRWTGAANCSAALLFSLKSYGATRRDLHAPLLLPPTRTPTPPL